MLALHSNRLFFSIGLAAVLSLSGTPAAHATVISLTDAPELSSLSLLLAGVAALLLSRVIGAVRSLWEKFTVLWTRRVS
jgi:hypothetical protein